VDNVELLLNVLPHCLQSKVFSLLCTALKRSVQIVKQMLVTSRERFLKLPVLTETDFVAKGLVT
jgi:hypothetical protein